MLSGLGISGFAAYDAATGKAGPVSFVAAARQERTQGVLPFVAFAQQLPGHRTGSAALEFHYLARGTAVYAAAAGTVTRIEPQHSPVRNGAFVDDFEVFICSTTRCVWTILYDHVQDLRVAVGDKVVAGQQIATSAPEKFGLDRFELQVTRETEGLHTCPISLLTASIRGGLVSSIGRLQTDLNAFLGVTAYDLSKQDPHGCLAPTVMGR